MASDGDRSTSPGVVRLSWRWFPAAAGSPRCGVRKAARRWVTAWWMLGWWKGKAYFGWKGWGELWKPMAVPLDRIYIRSGDLTDNSGGFWWDILKV